MYIYIIFCLLLFISGLYFCTITHLISFIRNFVNFYLIIWELFFPVLTSSISSVNDSSVSSISLYYIMQTCFFIIYHCVFFIILIYFYLVTYLVAFIKSSVDIFFINLVTLFPSFNYFNITCVSFSTIVILVFFSIM